MQKGFGKKGSGLVIFTLVLISAIVSGCSLAAGLKKTPTVPNATATKQTIPTVTPVPTRTPLPPVTVLLAPAGADGTLVNDLQDKLQIWSRQAGMRFQVLPSLTADAIGQEDYRLVVVLPPAPGLQDLVKAAPDVRFLAVGFDDLEPAANLSVIGTGGGLIDQQAFLAGYLSVMITPNWRVGMIAVADSPLKESARTGFVNGALYYCPSPMGACSPSHAPFYEYPLYIEMNRDSSDAEWQSAAKYLIGHEVKTVYLMPGANRDSLIDYLAQQGVDMIGERIPPENMKEHWVATLGFDLEKAFDTYWETFASGDAGKAVSLTMAIGNINESLLTPGKQRLAEEMLDELKNGFIDTGVSHGSSDGKKKDEDGSGK